PTLPPTAPASAAFVAPLAAAAAFDAVPPDDVLDAHLGRLLASAPCPAPDGFTQRVIAALPPLPLAPAARPARRSQARFASVRPAEARPASP
ncbi:hypothetical protein RYX56_22410, partial [Alkalihalophilus lindianensis]